MARLIDELGNAIYGEDVKLNEHDCQELRSIYLSIVMDHQAIVDLAIAKHQTILETYMDCKEAIKLLEAKTKELAAKEQVSDV